MADISFKTCELTAFKFTDLASGAFSGYASIFDVIDKQNERVLRGAFAKGLESFRKFGFVSWNHDVSQPIGTISKAEEDHRGLLIQGRFHTDDHSQRIRRVVKERLERGQSVGMSIGYTPLRKRKGRDAVELEEVSLFEASLLSVPAANPHAQIASVKADYDYLRTAWQVMTSAKHRGDHRIRQLQVMKMRVRASQMEKLRRLRKGELINV